MAEPVKAEILTWERVYELARSLAGRIRADRFDPHLLVAIGRGGYTPGRLMADFLHKQELTSFRIVHYDAGGQQREEARVVGALPDRIEDQRILVVDDVNDSGKTLGEAVEAVRGKGASTVRTAVLLEKDTTDHPADYSGGRVEEWRWIVYPWAVIEDLTGFLREMDPRPETVEEAARRLEEEHGLRPPEETIEDVFRFWPHGEAGDE